MRIFFNSLFHRGFAVLFAIVVTVFITDCDALPLGAPSCTIDQPAVAGLHLLTSPTRQREWGPISVLGLELVIDGQVVVEECVPGLFSVRRDHTIELRRRASSIEDESCRGVLLLLHHASGSLDMSTGLTPFTTTYQPAPGCFGTPVGGVTHRDGGVKNNTVPIAMLRWDTITQDIKLDVNVVVANNKTNSRYFYTQFLLEAVAAPTNAPATKPSNPPTKIPTMVPTKRPNCIVQPKQPISSSPITFTSPMSKPVAPVPTLSSPRQCRLLRFLPTKICCGRFGRRLGLCQS